ncbi:MAG TPA: MFS transporter [Candidatus Angelobacter sp.]|nr:MFS transporter [Candidatus Angelobacter sp.]
MKKNPWFYLIVLAVSEFLALSLWFNASSISPQLIESFHLSNSLQPWLTSTVQVGFIIGSFISSLFGLSDRYKAKHLFIIAAFLGAFFNSLIVFINNGFVLFLLRVITGICLAGVYPVAVKMLSLRFTRFKSFAIGVLVGALSLGSALPHLINSFHFSANWKSLILITSALSVLSCLLVFLFIEHLDSENNSLFLSFHHFGSLFKNKSLMKVNFGYFGHMWELYAMWTWLPSFIASLKLSRHFDHEFFSFCLIGAAGLIGSLLGGLWAERIGKINLTLIALLVSGMCCIFIVPLSLFSHTLSLILGFVWGIFVIMDSAQFSSSVSDFSSKDLVGTSVTFQMCIGYIITIFSINFLPIIQSAFGWGLAFSFLALGPLFGFLSMFSLKMCLAKNN